MSSTIYAISRNGLIFYVGSSFNRRFLKRQSEHRRKLSCDIRFEILEICEDDERFEREAFHINDLSSKGTELTNVMDPVKSFPNRIKVNGSVSREIALKIAETKRRNGTSGNGGKKNKGKPSKLKGRKQPKISASQIGVPKSKAKETDYRKSPEFARSISERWAETKEIAERLGVSLSEAGKIRIARKQSDKS